MKSSKMFITGCDKDTRWQLPWFKKNFFAHNPDATLKVYDFDTFEPNLRGWFKKPAAMCDALNHSQQICWLDTDCEVRSNLDDLWSHLEPNKIAMVEDVPWSKRRGEKWHNSGVVAFQQPCPSILDTWRVATSQSPIQGDQEVLHFIVKEGLNRMIHITDLPRKYNTLRLDLLDGSQPENIAIMHWTGRKGKAHIRSVLDE